VREDFGVGVAASTGKSLPKPAKLDSDNDGYTSTV
jgi:hypothetical protein